MSNNFAAIETRYKGFRFRSRTEARWAVFFDALGVKWDYERDGYDLGEGSLYLPDFWLFDSQCYAEVKGQEFTVKEVNLCRVLALKSSYPVVMLPGVPEARAYQAEMPNGLLGVHEWNVDSSTLEQAADRAKTARFEHGETPSQEKIAPRVQRGERRAERGERGASAEREIIRALLIDRTRIARVTESLKPDAFHDQQYRSIYETLIESASASPPTEYPLWKDDEEMALVEEILGEGVRVVDADRTVLDSLATLHARELDTRCAELDRIIPLAQGPQKDKLIAEKEALRAELNATGKRYYRKFKGPRR